MLSQQSAGSLSIVVPTILQLTPPILALGGWTLIRTACVSYTGHNLKARKRSVCNLL
jgi:hypothetical protein